jgi:metal-dependent hydrolase (beta-lactamase superfamily II)
MYFELNDAILQRVIYEPHHDLKAAIASTGHSYKDIKAVVLGHLHVDHAGGLEIFVRIFKFRVLCVPLTILCTQKDLDTPIWCHERELKSAFFSIATVCLYFLAICYCKLNL